MGFLLYDYLTNCDPLEFHFRILILFGFWPAETKSKVKQSLHSIYCFVCLFSLSSLFFIEVLDSYLVRDDLYHVTKNVCAASVAFAAVFKQLVIFYKIENVKSLYETLQRFKNSRTDPEDLEIIKKADKDITLTTKTIYSLGVPCITTWMLYPMLESGDQKHVPFPYRIPGDDWSTPAYEIVYTYHSLSMLGFMVSILSNDLVFYGMVIRINSEYDILMKKLKALDAIVESSINNNDEVNEGIDRREMYDPSTTEKAKTILSECSAFHQNILEKVDRLKVVYDRFYLIHFIAAVLLVGSIIMDIIVVSKGVKLQLLQRIIYSITGVMDTFLSCFFTTKLEEKSHQLRMSVYSTPWYKLNPTLRKDMVMITMRLAKPPTVKFGNFFPLNLGTFLQFLKISYNITALLYQTIKR